MTTETSHFISNSTSPQYGGFWIRFGSFWLDALIFLPFTFLIIWLNGLAREAFYFTEFFSLSAAIFYNVYCVKRWGGSPGKLICGLRIVNTSLRKAGWREAWLRYSVVLLISIISMIIYIYALNQMTDSEYLSLSFHERSKRIGELGGSAQVAFMWLAQIWTWSEFIVLLTNRKRRALHDFVAGTVVIRKPKSA